MTIIIVCASQITGNSPVTRLRDIIIYTRFLIREEVSGGSCMYRDCVGLGLSYLNHYVPDIIRCFEAIRTVIDY